MKLVQLQGQTFGRLTVVRKAESRQRNKTAWHCRCKCGNEIAVTSTNLRTGHTNSCGCLRKETTSQRRTRHSMTGTPIYAVWRAMIQRCCNPQQNNFKNYGGRGITVCDRWHDFVLFYRDMGEQPFPGASIERIMNDKSYSPDNCKWATRTEQANNCRTNRRLSFNGQSHTVTEWARIQNIPISTLFRRLDCGWSAERALTTPVLVQYHNYKYQEKENSHAESI